MKGKLLLAALFAGAVGLTGCDRDKKESESPSGGEVKVYSLDDLKAILEPVLTDLYQCEASELVYNTFEDATADEEVFYGSDVIYVANEGCHYAYAFVYDEGDFAEDLAAYLTQNAPTGAVLNEEVSGAYSDEELGDGIYLEFQVGDFVYDADIYVYSGYTFADIEVFPEAESDAISAYLQSLKAEEAE